MIATERNLLIATRDRLRCKCGYSQQQCQVEHDEMMPAVAGTTYIAVIPNGFTTGPRHRPSGGVTDLVYSLQVMVVKRITHVAKDRRTDIYLDRLSGIAEEIDKIFPVIDFDYALINAANVLIQEQTSSTQGFVEPLKFVSIDPKPRPISAAMFSGAGEQEAAMARAITFGGARRVTTRG